MPPIGAETQTEPAQAASEPATGSERARSDPRGGAPEGAGATSSAERVAGRAIEVDS